MNKSVKMDNIKKGPPMAVHFLYSDFIFLLLHF